MFDYFYQFYIQRQYGVAFILTEIIFASASVLLLSKPQWNKKGILLLAAEVLCSWLFVLFLESFLYMITKKVENIYIIYPVFLIVFVIFFSRYKWSTRLVIAPLFYALFLTCMGVSEPLGYILRTEFGWTVDATMVVQVVAMIGLTLLLYFFTVDDFSFMANYCIILVLGYSVVAIVTNVSFTNESRTDKLIAETALFILGILFYIMFYLIVKEHDGRVRSQLLQEKMESNATLVKVTQENYEAFCSIRHDIKNQYTMMSVLLENERYEELKKYFKEYSRSFEEIVNYTNCGNKVLDNLLNIEIHKAKSQNVKIESKVAVPPVLPYSDADMCSLLTNMLDNAIEACTAKEDTPPAIVEVNISKKQDYLFIRVVNPYSGDRGDGEVLFLPSTKTKENHGYGTKIIRNIAKKYKGSVKYFIKEGNFVTDVMLSMHVE